MRNYRREASEPCRGHPCDSCKTCQDGRCCRQDAPDYRLPEMEDWRRPVFGRLGVFTIIGETQAECHICGQTYKNVGIHATVAHDVTPEEYRAYFGLMATTALACPTVRQQARRNGLAQVPRLKEQGRVYLPTPEQISKMRQGRGPRLEERLDPTRRRRLRNLALANLPKARAATHENPEWVTRQRAWMRTLQAQVTPRKRVSLACKVCGSAYEVVPSQVHRSSTCSPPCRSERQRQLTRARMAALTPAERAAHASASRAGVQGRWERVRTAAT